MIKVFTTNKDGKIELTKDELKNLLDEAYWDGYRAHSGTYVYSSPCWTPYVWTATGLTLNTESQTGQNTGTINASNITNGATCATEFEGGKDNA